MIKLTVDCTKGTETYEEIEDIEPNWITKELKPRNPLEELDKLKAAIVEAGLMNKEAIQ